MTDVFSIPSYRFPEGFLWGSATAAHQIEGNNIHSDKWKSEQDTRKIYPDAEASGMACNHYNMVEEDVALIKTLGHGAFRLGVEWARIQPCEGVFDQEATEHYLKELALLKENGIKTFVTLVHFSVPQWFAEKEGWGNLENYKYFEAYLHYIVPKIAPLVDFWCVFNEFNLEMGEVGLKRKFNQVICHARAYHLIKQYSSAPVSTAHALIHHFAKRQYDAFDKAAQAWTDVLMHEYFFHAIRTGELVVPTVGSVFDKEIKDTCDYWAINLYTRELVDTRVPNMNGARFPFNKMQMISMPFYHEEFFPEAMYHCLNRLKDRPVYITENGVSAKNDEFRLVYIAEYLCALSEAIKDGVDVRGYLHWSLMDNWEWGSYIPQFGLVGVDREHDFKRMPKPSAYFYREIIEHNGYEPEMLKKYLKELPRLS